MYMYINVYVYTCICIYMYMYIIYILDYIIYGTQIKTTGKKNNNKNACYIAAEFQVEPPQ